MKKTIWVLSIFRLTIIMGLSMFSVSSFSQSLFTDNTRLFSNDSDIKNCKEMQLFFQDTMVKGARPGGIIIAKKGCIANVDYLNQASEQFNFLERLNLIELKNSGYVLKENKGVFNIFPSNYTPPLLNVKISELRIEFDTNLGIVMDKIIQTPEVK